MGYRGLVFAGLALSAVMLSGCGGVCDEDTLQTVSSPGGLYSVSVISADCPGASKTQSVVLRSLAGLIKGSKVVAVYDDSDDRHPARISVRWELDRKLIIHGHGAKIWSFQPNWHAIRVDER